MALTLPLQVLDSVRRCYCSIQAGPSNVANDALFDTIIAQASLFDVIKWQRVSSGFRKAAHKRLDVYTRIDVRVYSSLQKLRNDKANTACYDWHPTMALMMVELGPNHLGIAIDSELNWKAVKALLHLLITFRRKIQQLYIDSPVIELLVAEVNKQQVNFLLASLCGSRKSNREENFCNEGLIIAPLIKQHLPSGPFFPHLKQLTITSQSNQLEHLSRLLSYAVSVNLIYHVEQIDLLCLKICISSAWSRSRNFRLFRHLTRFRQWAEADLLGERYFQQFGAYSQAKRTRCTSSPSQ
uniref:F-box domain-containing protein n=1 Tax=Ascaris lumbricoides TaxID=6252 RepID=A0A9J2PJN5_ASCLU